MFILLGIVLIVSLSLHPASRTEWVRGGEWSEGSVLPFDKSMIRRLIRLAEGTRRDDFLSFVKIDESLLSLSLSFGLSSCMKFSNCEILLSTLRVVVKSTHHSLSICLDKLNVLDLHCLMLCYDRSLSLSLSLSFFRSVCVCVCLYIYITYSN